MNQYARPFLLKIVPKTSSGLTGFVQSFHTTLILPFCITAIISDNSIIVRIAAKMIKMLPGIHSISSPGDSGVHPYGDNSRPNPENLIAG